VNWQHLKTIAWLRWRLTANQWKKGGSVNAILGLVLLGVALLVAGVSLVISFALGLTLFPRCEPDHLLVFWDVLVIVFLFFWLTGLMTELQRSEALSFDKLLHLPVSLRGTFLLNYLSSLISLSLIVFLPTAIGVSLALVWVKGPALLILFPLLATFLLLVTGLTHQLREWLHVLMLNKRRRRAIIAFLAAAFVLLAQTPNLINIAVQRGRTQERLAEDQQLLTQLQQQLASGELDAAEYGQALVARQAQQLARREQEQQARIGHALEIALLANAVLPVGWLPLGARAAAAGSVWPGLLGSLGALTIGCWSLWRSYRTALRYYTGGFRTGERKTVLAAGPAGAARKTLFVERQIRGVPDPAAAVALGMLRSLLRSPEGKMLLLAPLLLLGLFSVGLFAGRLRGVPEPVRPMLALGAISLTMLCFIQLLCNTFGIDRDGFRALVLSPCRRRDILLGKNLAFAVPALGVCLLTLAILQVLQPMPCLHFLGSLLQMLIGFMLCSLLGNWLSIFLPAAIGAGSLKPAKARVSTILIHVVMAMLSPLVLLPGVACLSAELLLDELQVPASLGVNVLPVYLLLSLLECGLVLWIYRRCLDVQARWLERREQSILEVVTSRAE